MTDLYAKLSAMHRALAAIPKYVLLDKAGEPLPRDAPTHCAVLIPAANIIVWPQSLGHGNDNQAAAEQRCRDFGAMGRDDWRLASRDDWNHILDLTRSHPAFDPIVFYGIKAAWHWTSTSCAWSKDKAGVASAAWFVGAGYGGVSYLLRDYGGGFALAVRSAGQ